MHYCVRLIGLSHSAAQRLAQVLIHWDMHEDDEPKDKPHLWLPLTHKELAEIVGVSRETVTRLLNTFEQRAIVHCRGRTLVIEDGRTLRALASPAA
jgi:CRP/FNR family transcriptional regulator